MLLAFTNHTITLHSWSDKRQMLAFLSGCDAGHLLLGERADHPSDFYSAVVHLGWKQLRTYGVGISSEGHGLIPTLHLQPDQEKIIFGFNSEVVGVGFPNGEISFTLALDSLFYRFLPLPEHKMLLVQHEIGVVMLTEVGQVIWRFSKDVITNLRIDGNRLSLEFMDADPAQMNIVNGSSC